MKCLIVLVLVIVALQASPVPPTTTTTPRSPTHFGETIKQLTNQLMVSNGTTQEIITLDTRTPPKIKQKKKAKPELLENSHAGIAIPVDEEEIFEQSTKNVHKMEKPTTNGGLSTWILLSGQTTPKPSRKPVVKPIDTQNITLMLDSNKITKPVFKKRGSTTTVAPSSTTKLVKIKASLFNNAKRSTTTEATTTTTMSTSSTNSSSLPLEAKDGENELSTTTEKKTRKTTKRKKNKNRRRKPSEKSGSTKLDKIDLDEKPIGTQLYNYLSREIMPTVGVGLVGLIVTVGLAGYYLSPLAAARRTSYDIDRRDKDNYYYSDEYSGGIAEEEAIGKVIAGMPSSTLYGGNYKTPTSRHSFNTRRVESTTFNVLNDDATPVAVPEHGPRNLRRRKRQVVPSVSYPNIGENEIDGNEVVTTTMISSTTSTQKPDKSKSIVDLLRDLFRLKVHLGLQILQNATQAVSKYVSTVQRRLDEHYKNETVPLS